MSLKELELAADAITREVSRLKKDLSKEGGHSDAARRIGRVKRLEDVLFRTAERSPFIWETLMASICELKEYLRAEAASGTKGIEDDVRGHSEGLREPLKGMRKVPPGPRQGKGFSGSPRAQGLKGPAQQEKRFEKSKGEALVMTEVYLDGVRLEFEDSGSGSTIKELIETIENDLSGLRRFVMELWIDGEMLQEWRGSRVLNRPISIYSDYKLKTASMEEVALEGLDLVQEYMKVTRENIDACVNDLRVGNGRADAVMSSVFDGFVEIVKTIDALARGGERYRMDLFRENPAAYFNPVIRGLEELREASDGGDSITAADILEYELKPLLEEMEGNLFHYYA